MTQIMHSQISGVIYYQTAHICSDYFEEMQSQMEGGKTAIVCLLHSDDELGLEMGCDTMAGCDDEHGLFDVLAPEIEGMRMLLCKVCVGN